MNLLVTVIYKIVGHVAHGKKSGTNGLQNNFIFDLMYTTHMATKYIPKKREKSSGGDGLRMKAIGPIPDEILRKWPRRTILFFLAEK